VCTFGDLIRVPGSRSSLQQSRAEGQDIRIVYSALEALDIARANPNRKVVMTGIGFETTAPTIGASILQAIEDCLKNYLVLSLHKSTPPVMQAILAAGETRIDGIICPGHVSAVIGSEPYEFIPRDYQIGCVVTGFELTDILLGIDLLVRQKEAGIPSVEIAYRRVVRPEGNSEALKLMNKIFKSAAADWRGMGVLPGSGLKIRSDYQQYDAEKQFKLPETPVKAHSGCICGEILRGVKTPLDCALFKKSCTPVHPVGPCMVSSEGACSAYNLYGEELKS
jgi:hydrogenase expression/formation protein HypD